MNILTCRLSDAEGSLKFSLEKEGPVGLKDFDGNVRFPFKIMNNCVHLILSCEMNKTDIYCILHFKINLGSYFYFGGVFCVVFYIKLILAQFILSYKIINKNENVLYFTFYKVNNTYLSKTLI